MKCRAGNILAGLALLYPIYFCTVGTVLPYSLKIEAVYYQ